LARSFFAAAARSLGAKDAALAAHARIERGLSKEAPALARALVALEHARSLRAAGNEAEAQAAFGRASAVAESDDGLRVWLPLKISAERTK
jgi:hypothetical protein